MKLSTEFDSSKFEAKVRAMELERKNAREDAVRDLASDWLELVERRAPKDTNRFINGWALAARDVGIRAIAVRPLRPSRFAEQIRAVLLQQMVAIEDEYEVQQNKLTYWYDRQGRPRTGKYARFLQRRLDLLQKRYAQTSEAIKAISRGESVGALDLGRGAVFTGELQFRKTKPKRGEAVRIYARPQIAAFGGSGRFEHNRDGSFVILHNLEAHASIIMRKTGVGREAMMIAGRRIGGRSLNRTYTNRMLKAQRRAG